MLPEALSHYRVILASQSPRRKQLLEGLGISFEVIVTDVDESFPENLKAHEIPMYLAQKKSDSINMAELGSHALVITADTIVWLNDKVLNKPANTDEAFAMLRKISGKTHEVFTGVGLKTNDNTRAFYAASKVTFRELSDAEITWYVENFKPLDKAGAYGIQEWIGYIGIEHIEGSFYNVMGLPTQMLYRELEKLLG
jgi:septum formation protein